MQTIEQRFRGNKCKHDWKMIEYEGQHGFKRFFKIKCNICSKEKSTTSCICHNDEARELYKKWCEENKHTFKDYCYMCKERKNKWEQTKDLPHLMLHNMLEIRNKPVGGCHHGWDGFDI